MKINVRKNSAKGTIDYAFYSKLTKELEHTKAKEDVNTQPEKEEVNALPQKESVEIKQKSIGSIKELLEIIVLVGSAFSLGMTCIRAAFISSQYNVPFYVVTSFSALYDIVLSVFYLLFAVLLVYIPYSLVSEIDFSAGKRGWWNTLTFIMTVVFVLCYSLLEAFLLYGFYRIVFPWSFKLSSNSPRLFELSFPMIEILICVMYWLVMLVCMLLILSEVKSAMKEREHKKVTFNAIINKKKPSICLAIIVSVNIVLVGIPWMMNLYSIALPFSENRYEIVELSGDTYAVVCESLDGKIIEKCKAEGEKLIIFNDSYQYISEDNNSDLVFYVKTYSEVEVCSAGETQKDGELP